MTHAEEGGQSRIQLAIRAAAALSAALRELGIPHEILGHTTRPVARHKKDENLDLDSFSRFAPFRGYVFKGYGENADASAVFSQFDMHENLDGRSGHPLIPSQQLASRKRLELKTFCSPFEQIVGVQIYFQICFATVAAKQRG